MAISNEDKARIFQQFRVSMGNSVGQMELNDDGLCVLLEKAVEDYAQYVQEWLIEHQWLSIYGKNIDVTDMAFAMTVRSLDFVNQYTYAYSKQVGLQANGPWELKKDYITIESGRQVYEIPAGREVNEVLWLTPPTTTQALFANMSGWADYGFGGGFASLGMGATGVGGSAGYYIAPAFDTLLLAADMKLKQKMLRSELVYKLTAGPNGTRLLHLLSTPGSPLTFNGIVGGVGVPLVGCQVWYHYYDTTADNKEKCRIDNPDIIKLPNEVPLSRLDFSNFNEPTKTLIRNLLIAYAKSAIGIKRGKFSGVVGAADVNLTMDYGMLMEEGRSEKEEIFKRLDDRLLRLSSTSQLKRAAEEAEALNQQLKYQPLGIYVK